VNLAAWLVALAAAAEGRPLFYWGARPAVIQVPAASSAVPSPGGPIRVVEVHAAQDAQGLALRLTFDRPVREALFGTDGSPVSGRLQVVLYCDADGDRASGWQAGAADLRRGAEWRLELGTLALGADPEEGTAAQALVTATLAALSPGGRRRRLWSADHSGAPQLVSVRGEWVELRLTRELWTPARKARLILSADETVVDGRIPAP
jgi:hypothetical protein